MESYDLLVDLYTIDFSKKECGAAIKRALSPTSIKSLSLLLKTLMFLGRVKLKLPFINPIQLVISQ